MSIYTRSYVFMGISINPLTPITVKGMGCRTALPPDALFQIVLENSYGKTSPCYIYSKWDIENINVPPDIAPRCGSNPFTSD